MGAKNAPKHIVGFSDELSLISSPYLERTDLNLSVESLPLQRKNTLLPAVSVERAPRTYKSPLLLERVIFPTTRSNHGDV
jgi:hypothetical protein